jgi:hypothetical protein
MGHAKNSEKVLNSDRRRQRKTATAGLDPAAGGSSISAPAAGTEDDAVSIVACLTVNATTVNSIKRTLLSAVLLRAARERRRGRTWPAVAVGLAVLLYDPASHAIQLILR